MNVLPEEFHRRANLALQAMKGSAMPEVATQEIDAFFAKYPAVERTKLTEAFITSLVLERLSTAAEPAAKQPDQKTA